MNDSLARSSQHLPWRSLFFIFQSSKASRSPAWVVDHVQLAAISWSWARSATNHSRCEFAGTVERHTKSIQTSSEPREAGGAAPQLRETSRCLPVFFITICTSRRHASAYTSYDHCVFILGDFEDRFRCLAICAKPLGIWLQAWG